jgi:hypothetical protein
MRQVTYEEIEGLITKAEQQQAVMTCTFRCTVSGQSADAIAPITNPQGGVMVHAQNAARRSVWYSIQRAIRDLIYQFLGRGAMGRVARDVTSSMMSGAQQMTQHMYSEDQKRDAVVRAFMQVQTRFRYDEGMGQWVWAG